MILVCGQREFSVHKAVLSARSKVFQAMFEHKMLESERSRVEIDDIDSDIMFEILRFIYTDKIQNLDILADALLPAADKYCLERLKLQCEKTLCTTIDCDNVADILVLADIHSATQLRQHAIDFISSHPQGIDNEIKCQLHMCISLILDLHRRIRYSGFSNNDSYASTFISRCLSSFGIITQQYCLPAKKETENYIIIINTFSCSTSSFDHYYRHCSSESI